MAEGATGLLAGIERVGMDRRRGGFSRHGFDYAEMELREWFSEQADRRGLDVRPDRNGNLWAWWGPPGPNAIVTGSHLDSVPGGGAFDGPLGVASALAAVDLLRARDHVPRRPLAVVVFAEEEGGRFGVPCLGSRLLTGGIVPKDAARLMDGNGMTLAEAMSGAGLDPQRIGRDGEALRHIGCFVELHVEQGRGLVELDAPVGLATSILAHGRWRLTFFGEGNHAGATPMSDRRDPLVPAARTVLAARRIGESVPGARATVGRLSPNPGGTNVISSSADLWLDARAADDAATRAVVEQVTAAAKDAAADEGCELLVVEESYGGPVTFDEGLRRTLSATLGDVPALPTGAGHDAGILAAEVPTAMLFVRNPTGVSHAPAEHAEPADCEAGARALATVLGHLTSTTGRTPW